MDDKFVMLHVVDGSTTGIHSIRQALPGAISVGYYHAHEGDGLVHLLLVQSIVANAFLQALESEKGLVEGKKFPSVSLAIMTPVLATYSR